MIRKAIYNDSIVELEGALLAGEDVESMDDRGFTPLHLAIIRRMFDAAVLLISHGASVNARTTSGITCLGLAICGGHADVVSLLLLNGADDKQLVHGCTPLELVQTCLSEADDTEDGDRVRRLMKIRRFLESGVESSAG